MEFVCEQCGKKFIASPSRRRGKHIFCSRKCKHKTQKGNQIPNRRNRVILTCEICGKEFNVIKYREGKAKYCSDKCKRIAQKGSGNPNWRGGISPYYNDDEDWQKIRKQALERDNYTCQICQSRRKLEVHHIIPYRLIGKHELDNLVTLCEKCHNKFERDTVDLLGNRMGHPQFTRNLLKIWLLHLRKRGL